MTTANPLRLLWLPDIVSSQGPRLMTTERFLDKKNVTVNRPVSKGEFSLYVGNPKKTITYFSQEADRFASASFESLMMAEPRPELTRSIGWVLIRGYYSAFFAMHALLRLHGWACTRIIGNSIDSINKEIETLYPGTVKIEGGLYFLEAVNGGSEILLSKMNTTNGGSHEVLWSLLAKYMRVVTDTALTDKTDPVSNATITVAIDGFLALLKKKGGAIWFTQVRNRVNYTHEYGAWYPYLGSSCDIHRINSSLNRWLAPPENALAEISLEELVQFSAACSFLVSLCRTTVEDLAFRSIPNSPFRLSSGRLISLARQTPVHP